MKSLKITPNVALFAVLFTALIMMTAMMPSAGNVIPINTNKTVEAIPSGVCKNIPAEENNCKD